MTRVAVAGVGLVNVKSKIRKIQASTMLLGNGDV